MSQQSLKQRRVGQTDLRVTELGLGCASLAGIGGAVPADQGRATVEHALDCGINYFDAAPQYGFGRAEHLAGDVLRQRRDGVILSTKVGRLLTPVHGDRKSPHNWVDPLPFDEVYDYSYDGVMRSFEDSLQRFGVNKIDILYVHDIGFATHGADANKQALGATGGWRLQSIA
ncbi:aldo/keto reductase [Devosia algicola]|uniref:Aldo/keto reductase n=1 Tax=Devosia algicola TaxID=3026418 RepID=A0ABY7YR51_9HYPH|nr:aldo/keto reductase [Devosia algicola]WDR03736.1 aldo/keto reductase [Devosia algicola]